MSDCNYCKASVVCMHMRNCVKHQNGSLRNLHNKAQFVISTCLICIIDWMYKNSHIKLYLPPLVLSLL